MPEHDNDNQPDDGLRFVTIGYFIQTMLGYAALSTYYNHINDEGWPQRVYPGGRPMLVYEECVAYMRQLMANRVPPPPFVKPEPQGGKKRHPGRPAGLYRAVLSSRG